MKKIKGLIAAPFTPFNSENEVNYEVIGAYANMLSSNNIAGVFINGSSGEGYLLTLEERNNVVDSWMKYSSEDFKVLVHVGSCCLKDSKIMAAHAEKAGVYAIGTMAPPFPKFARLEELVDYCKEIASCAPSLPFYYYHIPYFTGVNFNMTDFIKAVEDVIPNFAGVKYTYESLYDYHQCCLYKDGKYDMLHGQDETLLNALVMGKTYGGISGTASYVGSALAAVMTDYQSGDIDSARANQDFVQETINVIAKYRGNIVCGKRIMKLIGLDLGQNRIPFRNIDSNEEKAIIAELESINFFQKCNKL